MLSTLADWYKGRTGQDVVLVAIILIFFTGMLPLAASRVVDSMNFERYYTDAAVSMLRSNRLRDIAAYPTRVSLAKLLRATLQGEAKTYIESRKKHCYAVLPNSAAASSP